MLLATTTVALYSMFARPREARKLASTSTSTSSSTSNPARPRLGCIILNPKKEEPGLLPATTVRQGTGGGQFQPVQSVISHYPHSTTTTTITNPPPWAPLSSAPPAQILRTLHTIPICTALHRTALASITHHLLYPLGSSHSTRSHHLDGRPPPADKRDNSGQQGVKQTHTNQPAPEGATESKHDDFNPSPLIPNDHHVTLEAVLPFHLDPPPHRQQGQGEGDRPPRSLESSGAVHLRFHLFDDLHGQQQQQQQ